jgi:hypothetical protein
MLKTYTGKITELGPNQIFVFGSNTQGRHGKGAAFDAFTYFGAVYGKAVGWQGKSYAIITKDLTKRTHPSVAKETIIAQIAHLYGIAQSMPMIEFMVAYNTSPNLNGYTPEEMADMFVRASDMTNLPSIPDNMVFEEGFRALVVKSLISLSNYKMQEQ